MMTDLYKLLLFILIPCVPGDGVKDTIGCNDEEQVFEVKAGKTIMKISSDGGRIVSFQSGKNELLTNKIEHENFGSTLWTSPQSDWGWPPYPVQDKQEYQVTKIGNVLKMISKPDLESGFQFEKTWNPVDSHFIRIEYLIRNISKKSKAVAAWEVTRVACDGLIFFPAGEKNKIPASTLKNCLKKDGINWIAVDKNSIPQHQKLFATAREGWLAYAFNGMLFIKQFPDIKPEEYVPGQAEVEIYTDKKKSYSELENHGAYCTLLPGQSLSYIVNWYLIPIPIKINAHKANQPLSTFARDQIKLSITDN